MMLSLFGCNSKQAQESPKQPTESAQTTPGNLENKNSTGPQDEPENTTGEETNQSGSVEMGTADRPSETLSEDANTGNIVPGNTVIPTEKGNSESEETPSNREEGSSANTGTIGRPGDNEDSNTSPPSQPEDTEQIENNTEQDTSKGPILSAVPRPTESATLDPYVNMAGAYEQYKNMSGTEQQDFLQKYFDGDLEEFINWLNAAKVEYDKKHPTVELGPDGRIPTGN